MEAAHLRIRDVDLIRDVIYIPNSKTGEPAEVRIAYEDVRGVLNAWVREHEGHHPDTRLIAPRDCPTRPATRPRLIVASRSAWPTLVPRTSKCTNCGTPRRITFTARHAIPSRLRSFCVTPRWQRLAAACTRLTRICESE